MLKRKKPESISSAQKGGFLHRLLGRERATGYWRVSLNDYLYAAGVCYRGAFGHSVEHMSEIQMYRAFSDGRDGGMREIKTPSSPKAFAKWRSDGNNRGDHPFEILRGNGTFGVHLIPPSAEKPFYTLMLGGELCARPYIGMAAALAKSGIPSEAPDLERAVSYLAKKG
ncbi:Uncharacterised protein [uncultured archaeon]|nr:Uncharacterised protein [uncultured archaeon]